MYTISIKGYNRVELLKHTLESLLNPVDMPKLGDVLFIVHLDYCLEQDSVKSMVEEMLRDVPLIIICSKNHVGFAQANVNLLREVAQSGSEFNIDFDDDYHVYNGWVDLMKFYMEDLFPKDSMVFSGHLMTYYPKEKLSGTTQDERDIIVYPYGFGNHGTLTRTEVWRGELLKDLEKYVQSTPYKKVSQEWFVLQYALKNNLLSARPKVGRIALTPNDGEHFRVSICEKQNNKYEQHDCSVNINEFCTIYESSVYI